MPSRPARRSGSARHGPPATTGHWGRRRWLRWLPSATTGEPIHRHEKGPSVGNLLFLLIAIALSAVGIFVIWWRQRGPSGVTHGVDSFSAQMRAIAPEDQARPDG